MLLVLPNIEAERIKRQMSRDDLVGALQVSKRTYQNWQSGATEMPLSKLVQLSKLFNRSIDYLLGLQDDTNS